MFSDLTGITPGDEDAYARVLIGLWQAPGAWQKDSDGQVMRRFLKERCVPDAAAQWVYDAAQWAYDGRVVANARRDVLAHPGLGEERINDAARIVVSAIGAGRSQRDPRMALSGVFENPSLTREADRFCYAGSESPAGFYREQYVEGRCAHRRRCARTVGVA